MKGFFYLADFECPIGWPPVSSLSLDRMGGQSATIIIEIVKNLDKNGYSLQIPKRAKPPNQCATINIDGYLFVILVDLETAGLHANKYYLRAWSVPNVRNKARREPDADEYRLASAFTIVLHEQLQKTVGTFGGNLLSSSLTV